MSSKNIFHGNGNRQRFACRISERVEQRRRRQLLGDPAWLSTAGAEHARPAAEANRTQQSCGLWRPNPEGPSGCAREPALAGPDTHVFPATPPFKKATGSLPEGSVPLGSADGWGGSAGRFLRGSRVAVWRGSAGRWDGQWPSPFHWDSVTLIPFVPRPTDGSRPAFTTTAVEIFGCGRCPIKRSGYLDRP